MEILLKAHSGLRWVVLILLILAIVKAFTGWKGYKEFNQKTSLFAMISVHTQLLIGLILYVVNGWYKVSGEVMANSATRFFAVEHIFGMILAVALITIGRSKSKKETDDSQKWKKIAVFYTIGLILILISIPWPFSPAARGLF